MAVATTWTKKDWLTYAWIRLLRLAKPSRTRSFRLRYGGILAKRRQIAEMTPIRRVRRIVMTMTMRRTRQSLRMARRDQQKGKVPNLTRRQHRRMQTHQKRSVSSSKAAI